MKQLILIVLLMFAFQSFSQDLETYTYAIKGKDTLKMDVYSPKRIKKKDSLPVVLWMHGGGFSGGSRANPDEVRLMEYLTENGFIGISISYRLLRKGKPTGFGCECTKEEKRFIFANAAIDYLDAANYVFNNAKQLKIDTSKIIAGGSSAGAEGMLSAVFMKDYFMADAARYQHLKFAGVWSLAGALMDVNYITKTNAIPTVMFHGTADNLVPFGIAPHHFCKMQQPGYMILYGSKPITEKLDELGTSYYLHKVIGGGHELSSIPFDQLDTLLEFINKTMLNSEVIQTEKIITKSILQK
ncbi:alpha/beta hydrolase [Subsaximicrobium wynnwilliamsii]|uniref:Alpha/beta hydrolase n=1 Tax=Subsaximicrobium wynnwilliamsii TaxID=291179 RepID=A0A5C6ZGA1_9FLAO|nr:alpha/beta hydrolase [Subsaximicrobium wynnwilliamsii]TXD81974.1 alpha/beta hydrolase [Subsaximicrobium wynnwilliamsii]TXD87672.1 alpha/beta hydrolase [Subsaximicrobium wynnwilliamsii]TXE01418.1 alpha/beta hydrolase [Subsaximicrobium wynnwilliamsii]